MPGLLRDENVPTYGNRSLLPLSRVCKTREEILNQLTEDVKDSDISRCYIYIDWQLYDLESELKAGEQSDKNTGGPLKDCRCVLYVETGENCVPLLTHETTKYLRSCAGQEDPNSGIESHHTLTLRPWSKDSKRICRWCPHAWDQYERTGEMKPCNVVLKLPNFEWVYHHPDSDPSPPRVVAMPPLRSKTCGACAIRKDPENSPYVLSTLNSCFPKDLSRLEHYESMHNSRNHRVYAPKVQIGEGGSLKFIEEPGIDGNGEPFFYSELPENARPPNVNAAIKANETIIAINSNWGLVPPFNQGQPAEQARRRWEAMMSAGST